MKRILVILIILETWALLGPREIVYAGEDLMAPGMLRYSL